MTCFVCLFFSQIWGWKSFMFFFSHHFCCVMINDRIDCNCWPNSQYLSYIFLRLRLAQTCWMILYFFMAWFIFLGACSGEPASKWGAKFKKAGRVDGFVPSLLLSDFHIVNQVDADSAEGDTSGNLPVKNTFIHFGSPSRRDKNWGWMICWRPFFRSLFFHEWFAPFVYLGCGTCGCSVVLTLLGFSFGFSCRLLPMPLP